MKNKFDIPLSYNPIPSAKLNSVLEKYSHRHHDDLIIDFEKEISSLTRSKYAVALNSGTAAIHLGLKALGVQQGDIVLASTFTYVASINPILYLGASPFFIDSDYADWNMSPELLEKVIVNAIQSGKKPKVILVVHTYGLPAKMKEIMNLSKEYNIPVLEDAAEALGSTYQGQQVGTIGEVGILSFNNNKLLSTYGGGVLLTNNSSMAEKINLWANQSRDNQPFYEHQEIGYNYRMSPINSAIGLCQLESIRSKINHRRNVHQLYERFMQGKVDWQMESPELFSNRWLTTIALRGKDASRIQQFLLKKNIEARPVWKPMHLQPVFKGFNSLVNGTSENLFETGLCLPSGDGLSDSEIESISRYIMMFENE